MKYLVKSFVVTFFLLICTYTFAEQKIVVLDLKFVLNESKAGKGAQDFLKKSFKENQKKFMDSEKNLKKEENDLLLKKTVLSNEEYQKKADVLRKKVIDYQSQRRAALDKITTQRANSRETLLKKIDPILNAYIKENDISLVIDKKDMLGGKPEYDITKIIVEKLNKELPSLNLK
jgi:outer membrane protein